VRVIGRLEKAVKGRAHAAAQLGNHGDQVDCDPGQVKGHSRPERDRPRHEFAQIGAIEIDRSQLADPRRGALEGGDHLRGGDPLGQRGRQKRACRQADIHVEVVDPAASKALVQYLEPADLERTPRHGTAGEHQSDLRVAPGRFPSGTLNQGQSQAISRSIEVSELRKFKDRHQKSALGGCDSSACAGLRAGFEGYLDAQMCQ